MNGRGTCRFCTLGMLLLVERCTSQSSVAGGRLVAVSLSSRCPFFFQTLNSCPKPACNCFFGLVLIAVSIQRIQRLAGCVERHVAARNLFGAALGWHQLHQNTITARTRILFAIVVHASARVFEDVLRPPRCPRRTAITPVF